MNTNSPPDPEQMKQLTLVIIVQLSDRRSTSKKDSRSNTRKRGVRATETGREAMSAARKAAGLGDGERLTYERLAEKAYLSPSTVKRFLTGQNVDRASAEAILKVLGLEESKDILEA